MNVMKVAHSQAKVIKVGTDMTYRQALSIALKQAHKEYKAMKQAQVNPVVAMIEKRIATLQAITDQEGFVVVVGGLTVDWTSGKVVNIENAPTCAFASDALYWASRVQNGLGEKGVAMTKKEQIEICLEDSKKLLKEALEA